MKNRLLVVAFLVTSAAFQASSPEVISSGRFAGLTEAQAEVFLAQELKDQRDEVKGAAAYIAITNQQPLPQPIPAPFPVARQLFQEK